MIPSINSQATQAALLEWADSMLVLLPSGRESTLKVKKPEQLFDGAVFSALLEILDTEYNPARFEQSLAASQSGDGRRNMHVIRMGLIDFARRLCEKIDPLIKTIDFQALDRDPTRVGMVEILVIFVYAACFRQDDNTKYITLIQSLNGKYQQSIFQIFQEVDARLEQGLTGAEDETGAADATDYDADLANEAIMAELQHELEESRRQAGSYRVRLERLQDNYDELRTKHEELQNINEQLQKQIENETGNFDRHRLQKHLQENEALIANLENERNALIEEKDRLLRDKTKLEAAAQKAESLIDENQELKAKNEELSKKANMADNLRKKVEANKGLEAEVISLRNDRMELTKTYDQLQQTNDRLETMKREIEAYAKKMQGYEMDIASMRDQKIILTAQNNELQIRVMELEQRSQVDEAVVKDLQEKMMMHDPSVILDDPLAARPASLEDELSGSSNNAISMRNLEVQRLQAENAVLKSTIGSESDKGMLVQEMEDLRASRQAIQDKYNDILERFTVGQKQIDTLIQNMSDKGEEAYSNLRTQVLAEQGRSKHLERQLEAVKEQLADKERAVLEARGDLNAVEKSSVDALTELKNTDGMLAASLRLELEVERRKFKLLKDESEAMQKQLLAAFIDKDELRREAERANQELQKAADGHTISTDYIKQSEKMEKLRTRYKQLQQQYEQSDLKCRELDRTLKAVRAGTEASEQKTKTDQIIKNLQRENAMIATAWYDLSSRLQSNHVVLQRRSEAPKSWLNKQRQLVNATPRR